MELAMIGGTGVYAFFAGKVATVEVATPYGTVLVDRGLVGGTEVAFLPRHGREHRVPPHRVNYRANIAALRESGVKSILATAAVGTISEAMPPGSLVALTQFLDFTRGRANTFFDGEDGKVVHTDMTQPYCPHLRQELLTAAQAIGEELRAEAVYACAEGPRFETPAEIRMFRQLGADLVGMTGLPEVVLAREAGICYAAVAICTNWAAGVTPARVEHEQVTDFMAQHTPRLLALFRETIRTHTEIACACRGSAAA
jgi:5'-methylthioadenosine phosphorylase